MRSLLSQPTLIALLLVCVTGCSSGGSRRTADATADLAGEVAAADSSHDDSSPSDRADLTCQGNNPYCHVADYASPAQCMAGQWTCPPGWHLGPTCLGLALPPWCRCQEPDIVCDPQPDASATD